MKREYGVVTRCFLWQDFIFWYSAGFEDVIRTHFRLQKEAVLKQCAEWMTQCADAEEETLMRKAVDMLKAELDKL